MWIQKDYSFLMFLLQNFSSLIQKKICKHESHYKINAKKTNS